MRQATLIRHGQASFGADDYDCLSPTGIAQAVHLGEELKRRGDTADALWMGTMRRHAQTADACIAAADWAGPARPHAGFDEFDHVQVLERYDAGYRATLAASARSAEARKGFAVLFGAAMARWMGGLHDADYAESWPAFQRRARQALQDIVEAVPADHHAVVFTSGGVIAAIAQAALALDDATALQVNWTLANAGLTRLKVNARGTQLLSLNETGHFGGRFQPLLTWR